MLGFGACIACLVHAGVASLFLRQTILPALAAEDTGVLMMVELAPLPVAAQAEESGDPGPAAEDSQPVAPAPPAPEVEEKLSEATKSNQPAAEASPYETPPDSLARKQTEKKDESKKDEADATDAAQATPPAPAAAASTSNSGGEPVMADKDVDNASLKEGSTLEAHELPRSWQRALMAHLGKHKRYPSAARKAGVKGATLVEFSIDPAGKIISARLLKASGSKDLDRESLDMLRRAEPLPKLPARVKAREVHVVLPVHFKLR